MQNPWIWRPDCIAKNIYIYIYIFFFPQKDIHRMEQENIEQGKGQHLFSKIISRLEFYFKIQVHILGRIDFNMISKYCTNTFLE